MKSINIQQQLDKNRRQVAFDSYDITVRQLYDMIIEDMIDIAPEYQRHFVWDTQKQSQLIESLMLGIPVPSLYMATNTDSTWEVVDGVQRLMTIINFIGNEGDIEGIHHKFKKLKISGLEKLNTINGLIYQDLPKSIQVMFLTRPLRITVLNDRSDFNVRYDLFERLNTGGVTLHPQEIRNCVYLGEFNDFLKECSKKYEFRRVVKTTESAERSGSFEELVLRFFAYYEYREYFEHSVKGFLNEYMEKKSKQFRNKKELKLIFDATFELLSTDLPNGIVRGNRKNITPVILYEAISVGTAHAIDDKNIHSDKIADLLDNEKLKKLTTGATNNKRKVDERIEFVRKKISK